MEVLLRAGLVVGPSPNVRPRDVLGPSSPLAAELDGYEHRSGQLAMAEAVERALASETHLFVEAGTGTGKTLAYLVPAVLSGRKVVVSTATRALEEQIFEKDAPLLARALAPWGITPTVAVMKGMSNYVCRRRLLEALAERPGDVDLARIAEWVKTSESGDRAELPGLPESAPAWAAASSGPDTRIGASCKHFDDCFVTRMRREAERAQIVVVNHHLFFADLALRTGPRGDFASVIPPYDAVVFDEAHQLEGVATDFFGVRISSSRVDKLAVDARRAFTACGLLSALGTGPAARLADAVSHAGAGFFRTLERHGLRPGERKLLRGADWTHEDAESWARLDAALEALWAFSTANPRDEAVRMLATRAGELRDSLSRVVASAHALSDEADPADVARSAGVVPWIDRSERSAALGASPVDLAPTLEGALFSRVPTVVCTSATLATAGHFHFARARVGATSADELVVPSPFDFESRAGLHVAADLPDPTSGAFEAAAVRRVLELVEVTRGGAFILCTSNRSMRALHSAIAARLGRPVLVQGQSPKQALLARFRSRDDSVLVATMSFWEGVDVPGRALRLVVLDKIPFAVPTDPVVAARSARIQAEGGNAFLQYSVPAAAITLKQGFGRLIRSRRDFGVVAVLDSRLSRRSYGRTLLQSLPPAQRLPTIDDVRAFYAAVDPEVGTISSPDLAHARTGDVEDRS